MLLRLLFLLTGLLLAGSKPAHKSLPAQNGDLIFQVSRSSQSKAIQLATGCRYSHMGIIYKIERQFYVYEAVQPVKLTPLTDWIKRGEKGQFAIKRLKNAATVLDAQTLARMQTVGKKFKNRNYDLYFEWSDERIYCSELVWKIYQQATGIEIGALQQLREFNLTAPAVRQKLRERYGNRIPMHEKVISPRAMFESDKLITVLEH